jgi:adenylate cyclase
MSLRYRLFLWIGSLFIVAFILSFFWENYLTGRDLKKAEVGLRAELVQLSEQKREHIEEFLAAAIASAQKRSHQPLDADAEDVAQQLVLAMRQITFLVSGTKVLSAFSSDGEKFPDCQLPPDVLQKMLSAKSGTISWGGRSYFFLQMTPIPNVDLHFFLVNLEEVEFVLVHKLDKGAKKVLEEISLNMRMVAVVALFVVLLLLHRLSLRITRPISLLAKAAQSVGAGHLGVGAEHLEKIDLPKMSSSRHDEIASLCHSFAEMVQGLREKEKVKGVLNKVVSQEIAQEILKGSVHLGGEEKQVTVLFADIRNFTGLTQSMPPHEVIGLLNTCMTKISHLIDAHGGVIDKYVGDEVMALFGAPVVQQDSALQAILSALEMRAALQAWNEERKAQGLFAVEMGIGIHTGLMVAGNMGAENRLNYTVLGRNVNLTARLCSAAKGMEILMSKHTWEAPGVQARIVAEELPPMAFKGFDAPIPVYRVTGVKT